MYNCMASCNDILIDHFCIEPTSPPPTSVVLSLARSAQSNGFDLSSLPSLYFSVIVLFLLPIAPPSVGGAVDGGGRKEGAGAGAGEGEFWRGAEGPCGDRITSVIVLPPCDSPASLGE